MLNEHLQNCLSQVQNEIFKYSESLNWNLQCFELEAGLLIETTSVSWEFKYVISV